MSPEELRLLAKGTAWAIAYGAKTGKEGMAYRDVRDKALAEADRLEAEKDLPVLEEHERDTFKLWQARQ